MVYRFYCMALFHSQAQHHNDHISKESPEIQILETRILTLNQCSKKGSYRAGDMVKVLKFEH